MDKIKLVFVFVSDEAPATSRRVEIEENDDDRSMVEILEDAEEKAWDKAREGFGHDEFALLRTE